MFPLEAIRIILQRYVLTFSVDPQDGWVSGSHERFLHRVSHLGYTIFISTGGFECDNPTWDSQSLYLDSQLDGQAWEGMKSDFWGLKGIHEARARNKKKLIIYNSEERIISLCKMRVSAQISKVRSQDYLDP